MKKAFDSPNHTQAPNDLFDSFMRHMNEAELKVTLAVIRGTLGYHRDGFDCSISKMAEMTGLSENGVMAGAADGERRGTIERILDGKKTTHWQVCFTTSASEVRRKKRTSASEVGLPQPVRQRTSPSEGQSGFKESINKEKEKDSTFSPASTTQSIQAEYERLLGYKLNGAWASGESKAAKKIAQAYTPAQLATAYQHYKADKFWREKRLTLRYLADQMPEFFKGKSDSVTSTDERGTRHMDWTQDD